MPELKAKPGSLLVIAIVFLFFVLIFSMATFTVVANFSRFSSNATRQEQSVNLVEAGIDLALWQLNNAPDPDLYDGTVSSGLIQFGPGDIEIKVEHDFGTGSNKKIVVTGYIPSFGAFEQKAKGQVEVAQPAQASSPIIIDDNAPNDARVATYCPTPDNCKIVYADGTGSGTITFVDCNDSACTAPPIRSDVVIDTNAGPNTKNDVDIFCPTSDNCKVVWYDSGTDSSQGTRFVDCNSENCSQRSATTTLAGSITNSDVSLHCPASNDCKVLLRERVSGNDGHIFYDCNDETCSSKTSGWSRTGNSNNYIGSLYCLDTNDCKFIYTLLSGGTGKTRFVDCINSSNCSSQTEEQLDDRALNTFSLYCPATDNCKWAQYGGSGHTDHITFVDCAVPDCDTRTTTEIDTDATGAFGSPSPQVSLFCPNPVDCKVFYYDAQDNDIKLVDCDGELCSPSTSTSEVIDAGVGPGFFLGPGSYLDIFCHADASCALLYFDRINNDVIFINCHGGGACSSIGSGWQLVRGTYKFTK